MSLRIVNWNILAPGLLQYFWRSSYGLAVKDDNDTFYDHAYYDNVQKTRLLNIVCKLKTYNADIICLQEVTSQRFEFLGNQTMQQYIAEQLGYVVVSGSFKGMPFNYSYPPTEQPSRNSKDQLSMDSGVATLMKKDQHISHTKTLATAESFGTSEVFGKGYGSPFTVDEFVVDGQTIYVVNTHIKMQYPGIAGPVNEIYERTSRVITPENQRYTIMTGDFNAGTLQAAKDLFRSNLYKNMFDIKGHEFIDDHVFIGNGLRMYQNSVEHDKTVKLLEMGLNKPPSNNKYWGQSDTSYKQSPTNNVLVDNRTATTDHYPIDVKIIFEKAQRQAHMVGGANEMKRKYLKYKAKYLALKKDRY